MEQIQTYQRVFDLKKLNLNLEKDKKNVVITLGGCFYPLHKNHINILERGKQLIEKMKEQFCLVGCFLVLSSIFHIENKLGGNTEILDGRKRKEIADFGLKQKDLIQVDDILLFSEQTIGFSKANQLLKQDLEKLIEEQKGEKYEIQIIPISGLDKLGQMSKSTLKKGLGIIIQNRDYEKDLESEIKSNKISEEVRKNILFLKVDSSEQIEMSSTEIRELIQKQDLQILKKYFDLEFWEYMNQNGYFDKKFYEKKIDLNQVQVQETQIKKQNKKIKENLQFFLQKPDSKTQFKIICENEIQKGEIIGKGLSGIVYDCIYDQKNCVVKEFNLKKELKKKDLDLVKEQFLREVYSYQILIELEIKNILKIFGIGQSEEKVFIIMERCSGISLMRFCDLIRNKGNWETFQKKLIPKLNELCLSLHEINTKANIFHRDIQDCNILIRFENEKNNLLKENDIYQAIESNFSLVLFDFGLASLKDFQKMPLRGAVRYYSPESILNKQYYTEQSEVFSFGCFLYEIFSGKIMFEQQDNQQKIQNILLNKTSSLLNNLNQYQSDIVSECWFWHPIVRINFKQLSQKLMTYFELIQNNYQQSIKEISQKKIVKVLLIRHAQSIYNQFYKYDETKRFNKDYLNCGITEKGFQQCQEFREKYQDLAKKISLFIVSPLKRAFQTFYQIFQDVNHQSRLIIDPYFQEYSSATCDIGDLSYQQEIEQMKNKEFFEIDETIMRSFKYNTLYSLEILQDKSLVENARNQIIEQCKQDHLRIIKEGPELFLQIMENNYKSRPSEQPQVSFETQEQMKNRVLYAKKILKKIIQNNYQFAEKSGLAAVVTHSNFIRCFTGNETPNCGFHEVEIEI